MAIFARRSRAWPPLLLTCVSLSLFACVSYHSLYVHVSLSSYKRVITPYMCESLFPCTCANYHSSSHVRVHYPCCRFLFSYVSKSLEDPIILLGIILFPYVQVSWGHGPLTRNLKKKKKPWCVGNSLKLVVGDLDGYFDVIGLSNPFM